jgi:hypothetical protein
MVEGKGEERMKRTLKTITGQDTGIVIFPFGPARVDNWGKQKYLYSVVDTDKVDDCLTWLKNHAVKGIPMDTMDSLKTPGVLFIFDLFFILAPRGWN